MPCNAADTHTHPSVLLKTVFHEREGLQQQHFIYSFVQHKLFFSTTVVAQGAFQAWLEKLTSWYSQKQLAGRKATPAKEIFCLGITDLSGGILSTTRQTALLQDSPSQLTPKQPTLPQEGMAVTSRPGCDQDELLPTRHLNTGKMPPRP